MTNLNCRSLNEYLKNYLLEKIGLEEVIEVSVSDHFKATHDVKDYAIFIQYLLLDKEKDDSSFDPVLMYSCLYDLYEICYRYQTHDIESFNNVIIGYMSAVNKKELHEQATVNKFSYGALILTNFQKFISEESVDDIVKKCVMDSKTVIHMILNAAGELEEIEFDAKHQYRMVRFTRDGEVIFLNNIGKRAETFTTLYKFENGFQKFAEMLEE